MDENERLEMRSARRKHHIEICGYQRAVAVLLSASVATNGIMYGIMRSREETHKAEIEAMQDKVNFAEHVRDNALEQYGGLVLELQRHSMESEREEIQMAQEMEDQEQDPYYQYVGECKITYYCAEQYPHICGNGDGMTATGIKPGPGIVAVDPDVIELGSTVLIDGEEYLAADTGGAISGYHIDVCTDTHAHALELGTHTADVWIVNRRCVK